MPLLKKLGVPIIETVARENKGTKILLDGITDYLNSERPPNNFKISYGQDIDTALDEMTPIVEQNNFLTDKYPARWVALKYLENDEQVHAQGALNVDTHKTLLDMTDKLNKHLKATLKITAENLIADYRYGFINSILKGVVFCEESSMDRLFWSDNIDMLLTHRLIGPILMLSFLFGIYEFTFWASEYPVAWFDMGFEWLSGMIDANLRDGLLKSLMISGVIDGVGGVLGFAPLILFMFFCHSYYGRFGLHGKNSVYARQSIQNIRFAGELGCCLYRLRRYCRRVCSPRCYGGKNYQRRKRTPYNYSDSSVYAMWC